MAVGSRAFVTEAKERHGIRAKGRKMVETGDFFELVPIHSFIEGTGEFSIQKCAIYGRKRVKRTAAALKRHYGA